MAEETIETGPVKTEFVNDGTLGPTVQAADQLANKEAELQAFKDSINVNLITGKGGFNDNQLARYLLDNAPVNITPENKIKILESFTPGQIIAKFTNAEEITGIRRATDPLIKGALEFGLPTIAGGLTYSAFTPVASPLVAAIPAGSAFMATQIIGQNISKELFPYEILPEQRASFEAYYTFGAGLGFVGAPYKMASTMLPGSLTNARNTAIMANGGKLGPIDRIAMTALQRPYLTAGTELTALGGQAYGTYAAEKSDPGNMPKRLLSELMYGFAGPTAAFTAARATERGIDVITNFFKTKELTTTQGTYIVPSAERSKIKQLLKRGWIKYDGNEDQFNLWVDEITGEDGLRLLAEMKGQYGPRTTASLSGDNYLMALQKKLMTESPTFNKEVKSIYNANLEKIGTFIDLIKASGDPELVALAAKLQKTQTEGVLVQSLQSANERAGATINKITGNDTESAMKAGKVMETLTGNVLTTARKHEDSLYELIDKNEIITTSNLVKEFDNMMSKLLPKEEGPLIPLPIKALIFKARGGSDNFAENTAKEVNRLQTKIRSARTKNAETNAKFPLSKTYFSDLKTEIADLTPEMQLVRLQDELESLKNLQTGKDSSLKSRDKTKLISYLENEIGINYNSSLLDDLNNTAPISPELIDNGITIREAIRAKSLLLSQARMSITAGDYDRARILGDLADSIVDDLGYAATPKRGESLTDNQIALSNATGFSKSLHDVFSRAFSGNLLAKTKKGNRKIMPELLFNATFTGPADATSLKLVEMQDAMMLLSKNAGEDYAESATAQLGTMKAAQTDLVRHAFDLIVTPAKVTGEMPTVDAQKLADFNKKYANVLNLFPDVKQDLASVESANNLINAKKIKLDEFRVSSKVGSVDSDNVPTAAFSEFIGSGNNPGLIIEQYIGTPFARSKGDSKKILENWLDKLKVGEKDFPGATEGFVKSVFDQAFLYAKDGEVVDGKMNVNYNKLKQYLFGAKTRVDDLNVVEILRNKGAITTDEAVRMKSLLDDAISFTKQLDIDPSDAAAAEVPKSIVGRATNLFTTVIATGVVGYARKSLGLSEIAPGAGGIAVPQAAAEYGRDIAQRIPMALRSELVENMMKDPELFRLMMDKTKDPIKQLENAKRFNAYLYNAGYIASEDAMDEQGYLKSRFKTLFDENEEAIRKRNELLNQKQSSVQTQSLPTPTEVSANLPRPGPVSAGGPPVSNQPVDRARFASLFPEDRALIEGIGSLV